MEFKDKLKALRQQRSISQQALADAIFVSRSAVAKWENGLGVPSQDSMQALQQYFGVDGSYFQTEAPEEVIVEKNQKIFTLSRWLTAVLALGLLLCCTLTAIILMGFRFTSLSAAGEMFSDNPTIRADEYQFYLSDNALPTYAKKVKKYGFLYREVEGESFLLYDGDDRYIGVLERFPGKDQDYYLLFTVGYIEQMKTTDEESKAYVTYPWAAEQITVNGNTVALESKCFFAFDAPIRELYINGERITVLPENELPVD